MLLNGLVGIGIGLFLSAISKTVERAMSRLCPVVLSWSSSAVPIPLNETFKAAQYIAGRHGAALGLRGTCSPKLKTAARSAKIVPPPPGVVNPLYKPGDDMASKSFPKEELREGPMVAFALSRACSRSC